MKKPKTNQIEKILKVEDERVNARDLHKWLNSKQNFADWIKQRIKKYSFIEGKDFFSDHKFMIRENTTGASKVIDYHITLDMAKQLSMVENNERGLQARRYFVKCEQVLHKIHEALSAPSHVKFLNDPAQLRKLLLTQVNKVIELQPKAQGFERLASAPINSLTITAFAKELKIPPKSLFDWMKANQWIYRSKSSRCNLPHQDKMQQGLLIMRKHQYPINDKTHFSDTVLITRKGQIKLTLIFAAEDSINEAWVDDTSETSLNDITEIIDWEKEPS